MGYFYFQDNDVERNDATILYCKGKNYDAIGYVSANGSTVMKNSQVSENVYDSLVKYMKSYARLREQLESDGTIVNSIFQKNYEFRSPSAAATVVIGRLANGITEWKTADGKKLKEI